MKSVFTDFIVRMFRDWASSSGIVRNFKCGPKPPFPPRSEIGSVAEERKSAVWHVTATDQI